MRLCAKDVNDAVENLPLKHKGKQIGKKAGKCHYGN